MWPSCPALVMKSGLRPRLCQNRTSRGEHQTCNTRSSPLERRASRGDVPALHACCLLHLLAGPHAPLACTLPFRGISLPRTPRLPRTGSPCLPGDARSLSPFLPSWGLPPLTASGLGPSTPGAALRLVPNGPRTPRSCGRL